MTKEEKARQKVMDKVAKHLRFNIPTKKAVIKGQKIEYFQGEIVMYMYINKNY